MRSYLKVFFAGVLVLVFSFPSLGFLLLLQAKAGGVEQCNVSAQSGQIGFMAKTWFGIFGRKKGAEDAP